MNWKNLRTASGPATRVPRQIEEVISGDSQKHAEGVNALLTTLVQSGRWFSASAPAVDLILQSVVGAPEDAAGSGRALWLALDIATAVNEDFLRGLHSWDSAPEAEDCRKVIEGAQPCLLQLLGHDDPNVRAPAAALLALGQGDRDAAARALGERRTVEADPFALAHLLLASGFLELFAGSENGALPEPIAPFLAQDQPDVVRTAAALAHLAAVHDLSPAAAEALPSAMHQNLTPDSVGWCDGRWPHLVAAVGRRLGAHVAPTLTRALRDDLKSATVYSANQRRYWARVALDAAALDVDYDPWAKTPLRDLEDFSPLQREVISELAPYSIDFTGTGVPDRARARARWLGTAPPGVLERVHEWRVDDQTVRWPLWRIWRHEQDLLDPASKGCMPPPVAAALPEDERMLALLETFDSSYGLTRQWSPEEHDALRARAKAATDKDDAFARLIQEIVETHRNSPGASSPPSWLLNLWLVSGRAIPPDWDSFVNWRDREQLESLPLPRRERCLFADQLSGGEAGAAKVLKVLPLVPTRAATAWVLNEINARRRVVREKNWSQKSILALLQQVIDLAASEPEVKAALDDARRGDDWVPEEPS